MGQPKRKRGNEERFFMGKTSKKECEEVMVERMVKIRGVF